jgi:hypothetical protein
MFLQLHYASRLVCKSRAYLESLYQDCPFYRFRYPKCDGAIVLVFKLFCVGAVDRSCASTDKDVKTSGDLSSRCWTTKTDPSNRAPTIEKCVPCVPKMCRGSVVCPKRHLPTDPKVVSAKTVDQACPTRRTRAPWRP